METTIVYWGLYWDNGKMETTIVYWGLYWDNRMEISKNKKCLLELGGYSILNVGVLVNSQTLTSPPQVGKPQDLSCASGRAQRGISLL